MMRPQIMSITPENAVRPQLLPFLVVIVLPSPSREKPLNNSQNPKKNGSAIAEIAGVKVRNIPKTSSIIPDMISHPRPFILREKPIIMYIIPDKAMTIPNSTDIEM